MKRFRLRLTERDEDVDENNERNILVCQDRFMDACIADICEADYGISQQELTIHYLDKLFDEFKAAILDTYSGKEITKQSEVAKE